MSGSGHYAFSNPTTPKIGGNRNPDWRPANLLRRNGALVLTEQASVSDRPSADVHLSEVATAAYRAERTQGVCCQTTAVPEP